MNKLRNAIEPDEMLVEEDDGHVPTEKELADVVKGARALVEEENEIAKMEAALAARYAGLKLLQEKVIPEAMSRAGINSLELTPGWKMHLVEMVTASIPSGKKKGGEDLRPAAFARLEATGAGGLIKHTITIAFPKNEERWARKFERDMAQRKRPLPFTRDDTVHGQTLSAHVRQLVADGLLTDEDRRLFGVFEIKKAVVIRPKESTDLAK